MNIQVFLSAILIFTLVSCRENRTQVKQKQETPKALEDKDFSYEMVSKRNYDDLVESLYNELVSKNAELKTLEDKIDELNSSKADSTRLFNKFDEKNLSYFNSANRHIENIKDTLLRDKMKNLIANNLAKYNFSIARHQELLKLIEAKQLTISDLHYVLKIAKTLPLIEKYQTDNLPTTKSLEGFIKKQDRVIQREDSLIKK